MSTPDEYPDNFKLNSTCIILSVRTKLKKPLCPRTQCSINTVLNVSKTAVFLTQARNCFADVIYGWSQMYYHYFQ